jgi:hypothetical protein
MHSETPIGAAIALLKKEIAEKQAALNVLEGLVTQDSSGGARPPSNGAASRARRGKKTTVGKAAVEILRASARPMHGIREIIPALESDGYKVKHKAGLATTLLRTGEIERTAPGTFAFKGGGSAAH